MNNDGLITTILTAMKVTKIDVKADFADAISDVCFDGLPQAVWARRAKVLTNELAQLNGYEVLHIKRGFWEINPVFDINSGELYLLTSKDNFERISKQFRKKGISSHYTYDLLLYNSNLLPETSSISLFNINDDNTEHRTFENQKMLGAHAENVKKVYIVTVDYVANEAIEAELLLLNENYDLIRKRNLTALLHSNNEKLPEIKPANNVNESPTAPIVKLKKKQTRKSD